MRQVGNQEEDGEFRVRSTVSVGFTSEYDRLVMGNLTELTKNYQVP